MTSRSAFKDVPICNNFSEFRNISRYHIIEFQGQMPLLTLSSKTSKVGRIIMQCIINALMYLICIIVHTKPTASKTYLNHSSEHSSHTKRAIPSGLPMRTMRICSAEVGFNPITGRLSGGR